ncbi:DUF427 domain-containing protein [Microbacterium terricola]|uniref:DUF427 domain-containing protein n=1 Tax=Microbacterium terricola TaxID=344163 RepID=A0ABM8DZZ9_9MICO|nr:DUF427 domain-containing protein [Microbacterium terricola]UYK41116.1 DUF427 domain-containing protein [Microbacterium terricola]BDV31122.1 hypothetical protein Microterr_17820 [Microbacterium terricola]
MRARIGDTVYAEAPESDLIRIEGNWYFPPASVDFSLLQESPTPYTCPWKGECQYYSVHEGDQTLADRAWAYPTPYPTGIERVGRDFSGYLAFWKEVEVA